MIGTVGGVMLADIAPDEEPLLDAEITAEESDLVVDHLGGETVPRDELVVIVEQNGERSTMDLGGPDEGFSPGDRRVLDDVLTPGAPAEARLVHEPSGTGLGGATVQPTAPPQTGSIEGTVLGAGQASIRASDGGFVPTVATPLEGATVTVTRDGETVETTTTDSDGTYGVDDVPPGEYEVAAAAAEFAPATTTATVEDDETATADLTLDPLEPAAFAVSILDAPTEVDVGEVTTVEARVENTGEQAGETTVELDGAGLAGEPPSETVELDPGESETVELTWIPGPDAIGDQTLTVDSGDDSDSVVVEVLEPSVPEGFVAYLDESETGSYQSGDPTFTAEELTDLDVDGHLVIIDDVSESSIDVTADEVTVEDGVSIFAGSLFFAGDVSLSGEQGLDVGGASVTARGSVTLDSDGAITASEADLGSTWGDVTLTAGDDVNLQGASLFTTFGFGDLTVGFSDGNATLFVDGASFSRFGFNRLTYSPSGVTVEGDPASGFVST